MAGQASELSPAVLRAARTMAIDRVTAEVVRAFAARDIPSILLKGPAVARWLYTDGTVRGYCDSDLLVRQDDFERAEGILTDLGFVHPPLEDTPGDKPWHGHAWIRMLDGAVVDLHHTLTGIDRSQDLWGFLAPTAESMEVGGESVLVLDEPGRTMHVALHAAQNGPRRPQTMADLTRAVDQLPPSVWDAASILAEGLGARPAMGAGLRLLERGSSIADRLGLPTRFPIATALRANGASPPAVSFAWLASRPGIRAKTLLVAHKCFPSPAFMRAWTPMARSGQVGLFLAYPYRLWWLATQTPTAVTAWWRARGEADSQRPIEHHPGPQ